MWIYEEFRRLGYSEEESRQLEKDSKINSGDIGALLTSDYAQKEIEEAMKKQGITIRNPDGSIRDFCSVIDGIAAKCDK